MEPSKANYVSQYKLEKFNIKDYQEASTLRSEIKVHYPRYPDYLGEVNSAWHVDPLWASFKQRGDSQQDIETLHGFCVNGIEERYGRLCRVGILGTAREEIRTKECKFVCPMDDKNDSYEPVYKLSEGSERNESEGLGHNASMVVDTFVDESIRRKLAASICNNLFDSKDLEKHDDFYECVAEFGFEHIIVLGEIIYGLLFLDCHGRVFKWEEMAQVLLPIGNSLMEVELRIQSGKRRDPVEWIVENDRVEAHVIVEEPRNTSAAKGVKNKNLKKKKRGKGRGRH